MAESRKLFFFKKGGNNDSLIVPSCVISLRPGDLKTLPPACAEMSPPLNKEDVGAADRLPVACGRLMGRILQEMSSSLKLSDCFLKEKKTLKFHSDLSAVFFSAFDLQMSLYHTYILWIIPAAHHSCLFSVCLSYRRTSETLSQASLKATAAFSNMGSVLSRKFEDVKWVQPPHRHP